MIGRLGNRRPHKALEASSERNVVLGHGGQLFGEERVALGGRRRSMTEVQKVMGIEMSLTVRAVCHVKRGLDRQTRKPRRLRALVKLAGGIRADQLLFTMPLIRNVRVERRREACSAEPRPPRMRGRLHRGDRQNAVSSPSPAAVAFA
jgi:hypothetical protein